MALKRLGTNATNTLPAMKAGLSSTATGSQNATNIAILNNHVQNDLVLNASNPPTSAVSLNSFWFGAGGGGLDKNGNPTSEGCGLITIPNRGVLKVLYGDVVAYDNTTGWPILVSAYAIANGPWTFA